MVVDMSLDVASPAKTLLALQLPGRMLSLWTELCVCVCVGGGLVLNTFLKQASLAVFVGGGRYPGPVLTPALCLGGWRGCYTGRAVSVWCVYELLHLPAVYQGGRLAGARARAEL